MCFRSPQNSSLAPLLAEQIDNDPAPVQEINTPFQPVADAASGSAVLPTVTAPSVLKYTEEERRLAGLARAAAGKQNVLYHGTRYAQSILRTGVLFASESAPVSLTRSPEVAAYFALLPRDDGEERGAILIFDRERLRCRYRIHPLEDSVVEIWNTHNEAEEELLADVTDISSYLIGFVSEPAALRSDRVRTLNCKRRIDGEKRLRQLLHSKPDWRFRPKKEVQSNLKKSDLARMALFDGMTIEKAAKQAGLSVGAVRRLSARLRVRVSARNESRLNCSLREVVSSWDLNGLPQKFPNLQNRLILPRDLLGVFGKRRINALTQYCGLSGEEALHQLAEELARLMPGTIASEVHAVPASATH